MLKTEKFYAQSNALKDDAFPMLDYATALVRNTELARMQDKDTFKKGKAIIEKDHTDIDVMTCDESVINVSLGNDAGQFIKDRAEIKALQEECANCLSMDKITALCLTDRIHVTLMAHAIYKNVVLDSDTFDIEKGGVDISKAIQSYYNKGSMKDLKDALRPVFNKLLGSEGDHFYAIKTSRADFEEKDLRNFLASFGGAAKREITKKGNDVVFGNYNYADKSGNKKIQIAAFTTLCAVVLDNAKKHSVIKPEEEKQEEKATA